MQERRVRLGEWTGPEWEGAGTAVVLVPVGSTEQHGPHLPMDTDVLIAEAICLAAAERSDDLVVAPAIAYGVSYHHRDLPGGALSVSSPLLAQLVVAVLDGLVRTDSRRAVILVNGHGGNVSALLAAADEIARLRGQLKVASCSWWELVDDVTEELRRFDLGKVGHAGAIETSMMLAIRPQSVRLDRLPEGTSSWPDAVFYDARLSRWIDFARYFPEGVVGSPRHADAAVGEAVLAAAGERLAALAADFRSKE